jgi:hypothetical protein
VKVSGDAALVLPRCCRSNEPGLGKIWSGLNNLQLSLIKHANFYNVFENKPMDKIQEVAKKVKVSVYLCIISSPS